MLIEAMFRELLTIEYGSTNTVPAGFGTPSLVWEGRTHGSTYKPTQSQTSYILLREAQIKSANCNVKI